MNAMNVGAYCCRGASKAMGSLSITTAASHPRRPLITALHRPNNNYNRPSSQSSSSSSSSSQPFIRSINNNNSNNNNNKHYNDHNIRELRNTIKHYRGKYRGPLDNLSSRDPKLIAKYVDKQSAVANGYVINPTREHDADITRIRSHYRKAKALEKYGGKTKREYNALKYGPFSNGADVRLDPESVPRAPEEYRSYIPAVVEYVTKVWLPKYPMGARTKRLRRDLAFRMKDGPSPKKKLSQEIVRGIAGEVARMSDEVELWENNRGMMKLKKREEKEEEEEVGDGEEEEEEEEKEEEDPVEK